ncbi:hypothetical protein L6164_036531 [Bauhinia variegata]|uniref:Uncharacterized protein n=1 Tax=Bauhinia variegata TaxID=167791 RepID=A0ACB9KHB7_BAUVA|nr:hypothetical protein L6164_036531 [Bauhinia variegata]
MGLSFHASLINVLLTLSCFCWDFGSARSIITSAQFIRDPEIVSSTDDAFKLGFFSPQNTTNRYLGIWYLNESNVIWVANRNQPLRNSSGIFKISQDGNLVVQNGHKQVVWSSNVSKIASNSAAKLLDTGNLILQDLNTEETIWESFKHPCDTAVPSFKLTTNRLTGEKMIGTSWKSPSDPSIGLYSASLERLNAPEVFLWVNGSHPYARSGPWNGRIFIGTTRINAGYLYGWSVGNEEDGSVYLTYDFGNKSYFATLSLTSQDGGVDLYIRVAHSELASEKKKNRRVIAIFAIAVSVGTIILGACAYLSWKYTAKITGRKHSEHQIQRMIADAKHNKLEELPLYDFRKIATATNDFHFANLLGKGGFGSVYKINFNKNC